MRLPPSPFFVGAGFSPRSLVLFFLTPVILSGCSHTVTVSRYTNRTLGDSISYAKANSMFGEGSWSSFGMVLRDGSEQAGSEFRIQGDTLRFTDTGGINSVHVSTQDVLYLERKDHFGGAVLGLLGGIAVGVGGAIALHSLAGHSGGDMEGLGYGLLAILGGLVGGTAGSVAGAIHGDQTKFQFAHDSLNTR